MLYGFRMRTGGMGGALKMYCAPARYVTVASLDKLITSHVNMRKYRGNAMLIWQNKTFNIFQVTFVCGVTLAKSNIIT